MSFESFMTTPPEGEKSSENREGKTLEELEKKTQEKIEVLRLKPIVVAALTRLKAELPPNLRYHTSEHTDDVIHEVVLFALADNLSDREIELLVTAAAYHDIGFIERPNNNEEIGARIASEAMRGEADYDEEEIHIVTKAIEDTQLKATEGGLRQVSRSQIAGYLLDSDVSNFGREDFRIKADLVFAEIGAKDRLAFLKTALGMLESHRWNSEAARKLRQEQKEKNMQFLREEIAALEQQSS